MLLKSDLRQIRSTQKFMEETARFVWDPSILEALEGTLV